MLDLVCCDAWILFCCQPEQILHLFYRQTFQGWQCLLETYSFKTCCRFSSFDGRKKRASLIKLSKKTKTARSVTSLELSNCREPEGSRLVSGQIYFNRPWNYLSYFKCVIWRLKVLNVQSIFFDDDIEKFFFVQTI